MSTCGCGPTRSTTTAEQRGRTMKRLAILGIPVVLMVAWAVGSVAFGSKDPHYAKGAAVHGPRPAPDCHSVTDRDPCPPDLPPEYKVSGEPAIQPVDAENIAWQ